MTLFELDNSIRTFLDNLYTNVDEDGVVDADFEALEALQANRNEKIESVALYIKELTAEAKAIKEEADRLAERAKSTQKKADRLKDYLKTSLLTNDEMEFSTSRCKITFRKSEAVEIVNFDAIDNAFITKKVTLEADKARIKEAIKNGEAVDGAVLNIKQNIQIK